MSMSEDIPIGSRFLKSNTPFEFRLGGSIPEIRLAYETWGELSPTADNAIIIFTGLSPSAHAASSPEDSTPGWWEFMIGPGKPIDTDRWFVICVNSLGSCKGSTGPSSINPATGEPWRLDFPELNLEDIARATHLVVQHLGIERLAAVVGPSMGGMTALAWLRLFPNAARHMVNISSAARSEPFSIAIRALQREMIVTDPNYRDGQYTDEAWPENGMCGRRLRWRRYWPV